MIEHAPRVAREFYIGPDGDRWLLTRDTSTGQPYVLHCLVNEGREVELDLGSFLVLFQGPERNGLMRLIASVLPDDEQVGQDDGKIIRPARFLPRWMPSSQNQAG